MHRYKWKKRQRRRHCFNCCGCATFDHYNLDRDSIFSYFSSENHTHNKAIQNINPNEVYKRQLKHQIKLKIKQHTVTLVGFDRWIQLNCNILVTLIWFHFSQRAQPWFLVNFYFPLHMIPMLVWTCSIGYVILSSVDVT